MLIRKVLAVFFGGATGAALRYLLLSIGDSRTADGPSDGMVHTMVGVLLINMFAALSVGFLDTLIQSELLRCGVISGIFGGFSTLASIVNMSIESTMSQNTALIILNIAYLIFSVVICVLICKLGLYIGNRVQKSKLRGL
jgi:fluoride ion exporter CrcB/FEX